jgi:hypothetical protein
MNYIGPITVAVLSKVRMSSPAHNTEIMGSNTTRGMDVCIYSVLVLSFVGSGLAMG